MPGRPIVSASTAVAAALPALASLCALFALPAGAASAAAAAPTQLELAAAPAVKIVVRGAGWTRVSEPELVAAGLDPAVDPATLRLYADGVEQAIEVTGNGDARFDGDEAIEFWGSGRDTLWTDARTYWLVAGGGDGKRVPLVAYLGDGASPASFPATAALRERTTYYAPLRNGDDSNFFGDVVDGGGAGAALVARRLDPAGAAALRVTLLGVTAGAHQVAVALGGAEVGRCAFDGQVLQTCLFSPAPVVEGSNAVRLVAAGGAADYALVESIEIAYDHALAADDDALAFTAPPATRLAIGGFSSVDARVVDVTDPASPVELVTAAGTPAATGAVVAVTTPGGTGSRALYAFTGARVSRPSSVTAHRPSAWSEPLAGELVILAPAALVEPLRPLAARRAQQGWSVQLVDLADVYDGFGGGDKSAGAIRDFLASARARWRVPPRFVLLAGDASFDPRNFLGVGDFDLAPTKLVDTQEMETASDDWFVDWDDDGLPDIAIGRLPVRTAAEAEVVVQKILGYGGAAELSRGGLFVAGPSSDGLDFAGASRAGAAAVAGLMPTDGFQAGQPGATAAALLAKLDAGPFLVDYTGHGSVSVWEGLLSGGDAGALTNVHPSIYVAMNCLNGFFHDVYTESLAESLIKAPAGGAVAVWASSALASFDPQLTLNRELLARLTRTSLGEAAAQAKRAITDGDARRTWILFGDPTLFGQPAAPQDAAAPDGGDAPDGGRAADGGATAADDGGAPTATAAGCACRVDPARAPGRAPGAAAAELALAAGLLARRARRRRRSSSAANR